MTSTACAAAVWEVALDWLAVGLDPEKQPLRHREPGAGARRADDLDELVPAARHAAAQPDAQGRDGGHRGGQQERAASAFFIYPVMQVANILLPRAHLVPVGEDQLPHIEMTREMARRFNRAVRRDVFPEPEALVGRVAAARRHSTARRR